MKRRFIIISLIVLFLILISSTFMLLPKTTKFASVNEVKTATIVTRYTARENNYYYFNLSDAEQKDMIAEVINWLNLNNKSISINKEKDEISNGGLLHPYLIIEFSNNTIVRLYYSNNSKLLGKIILDSGGFVYTENCPQLIQFLDYDWDKIGNNMRKNIH